MSNRIPGGGNRRKDGKPYKEGNTRDDGSYAVGKARPPERTRFSTGDGRKRGRRTKGTPNHDTEFQEELNRKIIVRENGKERSVTRSRAAAIRLIENAVVKGQNKAIEMVDERQRRIVEKAEAASLHNRESDQQLLEAWFAERMVMLAIDPTHYGDPKPVRRKKAAHAGDQAGANGGTSDGN